VLATGRALDIACSITAGARTKERANIKAFVTRTFPSTHLRVYVFSTRLLHIVMSLHLGILVRRLNPTYHAHFCTIALYYAIHHRRTPIFSFAQATQSRPAVAETKHTPLFLPSLLPRRKREERKKRE
jgi:hypothetical protein